MAQLIKNLPTIQETWVRSLGWEDPLEKGKAIHSRSGLENSMNCIVHGVAKSRTRLSDFHFYLLISDIVTTLICLGGLEPAREEEGPDH